MNRDSEQEITAGRRATKEKLKSDSRENSSSRKRVKPNQESEIEKTTRKPKKAVFELETDPIILTRRQKQIDYGKNTVGYHNYIKKVPIDKRKKEDPKTPEKFTKYSRRSWDMLIKIWRRKLHDYDDSAKDVKFESDNLNEGLSDEQYDGAMDVKVEFDDLDEGLSDELDD
ncbi:histone RNA hairpin-binding protein [Leptidea sinapis]|uniref:Histone RNA hairpin-binding protein RNA-binding domain-containing protein n=1 Tax=Leptidea sinapis TaxID=189913 RepID=A0A5E4Q165_9NEOP|nr:histone RNA hairpin-binding protein [Leptidea sinapis]VVC91238.1 unnamed protein product [Leptidea sinapis]